MTQSFSESQSLSESRSSTDRLLPRPVAFAVIGLTVAAFVAALVLLFVGNARSGAWFSAGDDVPSADSRARAVATAEQFCLRVDGFDGDDPDGYAESVTALLTTKYKADFEKEFEQIKLHTTIGARILSGSRIGLLEMAADIALSHHEHWDGTGYPRGLAGETIPAPARIVSLADVFDSLTHVRPYKEAWSVFDALKSIEAGSGAKFDPAVVAAFLEVYLEDPR